MREIRVSIYNFYELTEEAQEKAYNDYLSFIEETASVLFADREDVQKAIAKCEELKTPWFFREHLHEINGENIRKELASEFEFYEDGTVFAEPDDTNSKKLHYVFATNMDANGFTVIPYLLRQTSTDENFDMEDAIRKATTEYIATDEGKAIFTNNGECFNIGDFMLNVSNDFCRKFGFEQVMQNANQTIFHEDEALV